MAGQLHTMLDDGIWRGLASRGVEKRQVGSSGVDGFDGSDGDRFVDLERPQEDTDVKAPLLLSSWVDAIIGVTKRIVVRELATPRETARSRSLRRVHEIDGERAEGLLLSRRQTFPIP